MNKYLPFNLEQIKELTRKYPTPFYIYDEQGIRNSARLVYEGFSWNSGFKEYFPIKAIPNPEIIKILKDEGCNMDCSSIPELMIAESTGLSGDSIMLTSNDTSPQEFRKAIEIGAIINLDDSNHLDYMENNAGLPKFLSLRYNPGPIKKKGKLTWKSLKEDKFGMRKDQLLNTYKRAFEKGIRRFGLHMMIISNDLNPTHFIDTVEICFNTAVELRKNLGIDLEFIDFGGGIGIPYRSNQKAVDILDLANRTRVMYGKLILREGLKPLRLFMESGRFITGQHGYLVSTVRHIKESYKLFAGLDASMTDLMRPGMYGAYHHISLLGGDIRVPRKSYDVVGSLCENNDKFAINRRLPILKAGDIVVIHDAGAYGRGKVFDFNGKLRPAEFLLQSDNKFREIRRAEKPEDYFRTISGWRVINGKLIGRNAASTRSYGQNL